MKFHCTYCGQGIESASDSFGTLVTCPGCGDEVPIPQLKKNPQSQLSESPAELVLSKPGATWGHVCQRIFLYCLLACFVVGAATAIFALLSFEFGEIQAKILLTTLSLGVYSLTGLCCAVLAEQHQWRVFGGLGIAISIAGVAFAILTNWEIVTGWEILIKGRFTFLVVAIAFGHASLLLMVKTTDNLVRSSRAVTLAAIALVAIFLLAIPLMPLSIIFTWTVLGVLAVVDALGTIATLVLHLATRTARTG